MIRKGYFPEKPAANTPVFVAVSNHMNGRIYDPHLGRMLQADPFIQSPTNTQSYNRYSYVLNNPLSATDPSGYFLKKLFKNPVFRVAAAVALAAVTYGAVNAWAVTAFSQTTTGVATASVAGGTFGGGAVAASATTSFSITTLSTGGAIASGAIAGASAGAVSGGIISGTLKGAAQGAFSGAAFGATAGYFGNTWNVSRVATNAVAGGTSSEVSGGEFSDGLKLSLLSDAAMFGYREYVGYEATLGPGGPAKPKPALGRPVAGQNNFGTQGLPEIDRNGWWNEGGRLSRVANRYPGLNSVAGVHDMFQVQLGTISNLLRNTLNIPGMPIAAVWSYAALINTPVMAGTVYATDDQE